MEAIAQNRPQELTGRTFSIAQQLQAFRRRFFKHAGIHGIGLLTSRDVILAVQLELQNFAAHLLVKTGLGLLAQVAQLQQLLQHRRRAKAVVEGIGLQAQVVLQRLDHMGHGVQAHHVRGTESAGRGAAQLLARQVVHHIVSQAEVFRLLDGGEHACNADAVGDEVGRVLGAHHALAQTTGHKGFELVEHFGLGGRRGNQLHQRHVAWGVEEVNATEAWLDGFW